MLALIFLLAAGCESGETGLWRADGGRQPIDCSASYLAVSEPGSYQCEQFDRTNASDGNGIFQTFNLFGTAKDGTSVSLQTSKALSQGYYSPNVNANFSYERAIQGFASKRQAQNWSTLKVIGGARIMSFTDASNRQCFGSHQYGGLAYQGYDHVVYGIFCRKSVPFTDEEMTSLLSKVVVRESLSSPLPPALVPKALLTCTLRDGSSFATANERGCVQLGGHIQQ
jgi:hypothetical protein